MSKEEKRNEITKGALSKITDAMDFTSVSHVDLKNNDMFQQGRRQGFCLGGGGGAKCFATSAPALKMSLSGGGGGTPTHFCQT